MNTITAFEPPPAAGSVDELREKFAAATLALTDNFERVLKHIEEHPRYNEKVARAKAAIELLKAAAVPLQRIIDASESATATLNYVVDRMVEASREVQALADENIVKAGSIAAPRVSAAPSGDS